MRQYRMKRGFTLMETLGVVAIIVILMGVAFPAVAVTQKNLKMKELDDTARQIFLVVQNRLTTMKSTGELYRFVKKMDEEMSAQKLDDPLDKPQDYGDADEHWQSLYYLGSDQDMVQDYLLSDSEILISSLRTGAFMVELNPGSGDVYSVFYSEDGAIARDQVTTLTDRTKGSRKDATPRLGYYGGNSELSAVADFPDRFDPKIILMNAEDLYLKIECGGLRRILPTKNKLNVTVRVTDESYKEETPDVGVWTKTLRYGADYTINALGELSGVLVLDSMRSGESFKEITQVRKADGTFYSLNPGDNIQVTVTMTYADGDVSITGEEMVRGSSLFASKNSTSVTGSEIGVERLRHLNNLRSSIYKSSPNDLKQPAKSIDQKASIDFDPANWGSDALAPGEALPTLDYFEKIINNELFSGTEFFYRGNGNELRNFVFGSNVSDGTDGVGLFGKINAPTCNIWFKGIHFVDCSVDGNYTNVGLLASETTGLITIEECRAYIKTKDEHGRFIDMDASYIDDRSIKGGTGSAIGGFVGKATQINIRWSFVAIPVSGKSRVGGLVGSMESGMIASSYTSGDVTASEGKAGGLIGFATVPRIEDCYSTANVTTPSYGGGIVGHVSRPLAAALAHVRNSYSYGDVKVSPGKWDMTTSGPLVGTYTPALSSLQIGSMFKDSKYFSQGDYNKYTSPTANYGKSTSFIDLCVSTPNPVELCFPYSKQLNGGSFPFPFIKYYIFPEGGGYVEKTLPHYGNWPSELRLQTSLVYYEKYSDDTYGYYAVTSLTTKQDDTGEEGGKPEDPDAPEKDENLNTWKVDTLDDKKSCIEDGYALMTIYPLTTYEYTMEDGTKKKVPIVDKPENTGVGKSYKMASGISLDFKKDTMVYRITNANVYQLPFELQIVERMNRDVRSFYTRLKINGFMKETEESTEEKQVIKDFTFFYCPDFAKNAVNPDPEKASDDYPENPGGEEKPIYVRSARQLNGLGRSYYYWNQGNNILGEKFYFVQERDIDFGTYTGGTKKYCGMDYDLMNTTLDNPYRNKPIGRPGNQKGSSFQNVYDGGSHKIIDFCMETFPDPTDIGNSVIRDKGYQYTGMFGEIRYAVLKNMVIVASKPGAQDEASSGYVKSHYKPGSNPGVGALVGLVYVNNDKDDERAKIINCAISGYDVSYTVNSEQEGESTSRGYGAVGGMVGFNYGIIEKCSVAMKQVSFLQKEGSNSNITRNLGGMVGSMNDKSSITNCYSSGMLVGGEGSGSLVYGGIAGGYQHQSDERVAGPRKIVNSYSTCIWDPKVQVNVSTQIVGGKEVKKWGGICPSGNNITMENCYYLGDVVEEAIDFPEVTGVTKKTFDELIHVPELGSFGAAELTEAWPGYSETAYPFPAIVRTDGGKGMYIHYGSGYGTSPLRPSAMIAYYEVYKNMTTGKEELRLSYLRPSGTLTSNLPRNEGTVEKSGYGVLVAEAEGIPDIEGISDSDYESPTVDGDKILLGGFGTYALRPFTQAAMDRLSEGTEVNALTMSYKITDDTEGVTKDVEHVIYLNVKFAEAMSLNEDLGKIENPLRIRTLAQLQNMTDGQAPEGGYFVIKETIQASDLSKGLVSDGFKLDGGYEAGGKRIRLPGYDTREVGGDGCYIVGLRRPLFSNIDMNSTVDNLALLGVNIQGTGNMAAIAESNSGKISDCLAHGKVESIGASGVGGLVHTNTSFGMIQKSYFSGTTAGTGAGGVKTDAGALVFDNKGTISNCYTSGNVEGGQVAGFVFKNSGNIAKSYALTDVTKGNQRYGFTGGPKSIDATAGCYWARSKSEPFWNNGVDIKATDGAHEADFGAMKNLSLGTDWVVKADAGVTYPDSPAYKDKGYAYPRLKLLDHYGDWPLPPVNRNPLAGFVVCFPNNPGDYYGWVADEGLDITSYKAGSSPMLPFICALLPLSANNTDYSFILSSKGTKIYTAMSTEITLTPKIEGFKAVFLQGTTPIKWGDFDTMYVYPARSTTPIVTFTIEPDGTVTAK